MIIMIAPAPPVLIEAFQLKGEIVFEDADEERHRVVLPC